MGKDDPSLWLPIHHLIHLYWASSFYSKEVIQAISKILKFNSFNFSSTFLVRIKSSHMSFCIYQCFHLNKYLCYPKFFKTHLKKKNYRINYLFIFPWQLQRKSCPAAPQPFECLSKLDPFLTPSKHTFPLVKSSFLILLLLTKWYNVLLCTAVTISSLPNGTTTSQIRGV